MTLFGVNTNFLCWYVLQKVVVDLKQKPNRNLKHMEINVNTPAIYSLESENEVVRTARRDLETSGSSKSSPKEC